MRSAIITMALCAVAGGALLAAEARADTLYGTELNTGKIYSIDTATGATTFVAATTAVVPRPTSSSPNGNAFDPATGRFFFANFTDPGTPPNSATPVSTLYWIDVNDPGAGITTAGRLAGHASDAAFHDGAYYYIGHGTDELCRVSLDAAGLVSGETNVAGLTGDSMFFGFGDIAIDCAGVVYGSATERAIGNSVVGFPFFRYDMASGDYDLLSTVNGGTQVAFGESGTLFGHAAGTGDFSTVDLATGAHTRIFTGRKFSDLAGNVVCERTCETTVGLCAGQHIGVGTVTVTSDDSELCVTYETTGGWEMTEIHLSIQLAPEDFPTTKKGSPKVGHFETSRTLTVPSTSETFCFDLEDLGIDGDTESVYVAAHAVVRKGRQQETAWGAACGDAGTRFVRKGNWATYFEHALDCD